MLQVQDMKRLARWTHFDVEEVCWLVESLKGVRVESLQTYSHKVRDNNVSGLVLQNCDLAELQPIMEMRFGDWQLFRAAIVALREWDFQYTESDMVVGNVSNSSSSIMSPPSTGFFEKSGAGVSAGRRGSEGMVGPKGRRMRRNDSIVQQLSYEAAIINEAVEEFVEDTDDGEEEEEAEEVDGAKVDSTAVQITSDISLPDSATVLDLLPDDARGEAQPLIPPQGKGKGGDLSDMVTVIEDCPLPGQALLDSPHTVTQFSAFLFQSTSQDISEAGITVEVHDPHSGHGQGQSLSSSYETVTRPIIHNVGDSSPGNPPLTQRTPVDDPLREVMLANAGEVRSLSPLDTGRFDANPSSATSVSFPSSPPSFFVGSGPSSPTEPTLTVENEIFDLSPARGLTAARVGTTPEEPGRQTYGPWQLQGLHQQNPMSSDPHSPSGSSQGDSRDRESQV